jgi:hypothetical protein
MSTESTPIASEWSDHERDLRRALSLATLDVLADVSEHNLSRAQHYVRVDAGLFRELLAAMEALYPGVLDMTRCGRERKFWTLSRE